MARDAAALQLRNQQLRADFDKLQGKGQAVRFDGKHYPVRLQWGQIIAVLAARYFLSVRTVEALVNATGEAIAA